MLPAGDDADVAAPEARKALRSARSTALREQCRLLFAQLRADHALAAAFFFRGDVALSDALAAAVARRQRCATSRAVIKAHHQRLRECVAAAAPPPVPPPPALPLLADDEHNTAAAVAAAARRAAWEAGVSDEQALADYADAATETGRRSWVRAAQAWCLDCAQGFLSRGGAARGALKAAKRAHFAAHGVPLPDDAATACAAHADAALAAALGGSRPRLLDVGSCHDPWRVHEDAFEARRSDAHLLCFASSLVMGCMLIHPKRL